MVLSFDGSPASIGMNMSTGCEFPTIQTFERAPSAADFESGFELTNFPAVLFSPQYTFLFLPPPAESESLDLNLLKVFRGCASDWEACSKWNPFSNGLDYLEVCVFFFYNHSIDYRRLQQNLMRRLELYEGACRFS